MATIIDEVNSDLEEALMREVGEEVVAPKKEVKRRAPKKNLAVKKESSARPAPRPHKKMCLLKLTATIQQLQHKQEEVETKLKVNGIRLRKLLAEDAIRKLSD
jgi:hypothetical protein